MCSFLFLLSAISICTRKTEAQFAWMWTNVPPEITCALPTRSALIKKAATRASAGPDSPVMVESAKVSYQRTDITVVW